MFQAPIRLRHSEGKEKCHPTLPRCLPAWVHGAVCSWSHDGAIIRLKGNDKNRGQDLEDTLLMSRSLVLRLGVVLVLQVPYAAYEFLGINCHIGNWENGRTSPGIKGVGFSFGGHFEEEGCLQHTVWHTPVQKGGCQRWSSKRKSDQPPSKQLRARSSLRASKG